PIKFSGPACGAGAGAAIAPRSGRSCHPMSTEDEKIKQQQDQSTDGGGEDLQNALAVGETEFVASDEKKPATTQLLYLLLLLAVGGGGMYYMYKRQGPNSAAASTPEAAKA